MSVVGPRPHLEKHEREMAVKYGRLENLTIAFWNNRPKKIGKSKLHVPSAFAKLLSLIHI